MVQPERINQNAQARLETMISEAVLEQHTSNSVPTRIARAERQRGRTCIEESSKATSSRIGWPWSPAAERLFQMKSDLPS